MKRLKYVLSFLAAALVFFAAVKVLFWIRPWDRPVLYYKGEKALAFPTERYQQVPVVEDDLTPVERFNPAHRKTRAEALLEGLPPGTEVYEFTVEGPGTERIWRSADGAVFIERETGIVEVAAYRKPEPFITAEFRPKVLATTDFSTVGVAGELDVLKVGRVHVGPGAGYQFNKTGWVGAGAGYNLWKNVDVGGYGGKTVGAEGWTGGVSVGIAIK